MEKSKITADTPTQVIAKQIIDHTLQLQLAGLVGQRQNDLVLAIQRTSRRLLLTEPLPLTGWATGLEEMIERIERGEAPAAKDLERHLVLLDVAGAKIRNFLHAQAQRLAA